MAASKRVGGGEYTERYEGVEAIYVRSTRTIMFRAQQGHNQIDGGEMSLGEFLTTLGITLSDCKKAIEEEIAHGN